MALPDSKKAQRHILAIDNDWLVLMALSGGLRAAGYRVTVAVSGEDALGIAARDAPDLVLLDVHMPGMSGIEVGSRLHEAGVPFLYLSANGDQDIVSQAVKEGAYGYLVKPLVIEQIVPSIESALKRAQEIKKLRQSKEQLTTALAGSRQVSMAVGLLMMRDRLLREGAFEVLRGNARSQRRPIETVAEELLEAAEKLHTINEVDDPARSRKRLGS